jgi:hypothetical protein
MRLPHKGDCGTGQGRSYGQQMIAVAPTLRAVGITSCELWFVGLNHLTACVATWRTSSSLFDEIDVTAPGLMQCWQSMP